MYLLFLDESGTHSSSPAFILGGMAAHENDIWGLQRGLDQILLDNLTPLGLSHLDFELHATEIKSPNRTRGRAGGSRRNATPTSPWSGVPASVRFKVLDDTYEFLRSFAPTEEVLPPVFFSAVIDRAYTDKAKRAYELVFNKFNDMLTRRYHDTGQRHRGLVVHDEHQIETDLQAWTTDWRQVGGKIGRLNNIVDVPLFSDSRASRMLQAADFIAFAVWRYYGANDQERFDQVSARFDQTPGALHGLIHVWPGYGHAPCPCLACTERETRQ